jgi:hypothetical protein
VGIYKNEIADRLAKEVARSKDTDNAFGRIPISTQYYELEEEFRHRWQKKMGKKRAALIIYDHSYKLTCQRQTVYFFILRLQECLYRHIGVVIVTYVTQVPAAMLLYVQPYCRCHSDE